MIDICKNELDWLDMHINVKKSSCMRIGKSWKAATSNILVVDKPLAWSHEIKYLGVYIISDKTFNCNTHEAKLKFYRSVNGILGKIGTASSLDVSRCYRFFRHQYFCLVLRLAVLIENKFTT
jgi:hypothetical protein